MIFHRPRMVGIGRRTRGECFNPPLPAADEVPRDRNPAAVIDTNVPLIFANDVRCEPTTDKRPRRRKR